MLSFTVLLPDRAKEVAAVATKVSIVEAQLIRDIISDHFRLVRIAMEPAVR